MKPKTTARNFLPTSPLYDSVELIPETVRDGVIERPAPVAEWSDAHRAPKAYLEVKAVKLPRDKKLELLGAIRVCAERITKTNDRMAFGNAQRQMELIAELEEAIITEQYENSVKERSI